MDEGARELRKGAIILAVIALAAFGWYVVQSGDKDAAVVTEYSSVVSGAPIVTAKVPPSFSEQEQMGKRAYNAVCADCHGASAQGRIGIAPPLVHILYEPSHHGDLAFVSAAMNGVSAHHWSFGNMPPVAGVTRADVLGIVTYVRALQRENGIE